MDADQRGAQRSREDTHISLTTPSDIEYPLPRDIRQSGADL
jgi:hypothetical protein